VVFRSIGPSFPRQFLYTHSLGGIAMFHRTNYSVPFRSIQKLHAVKKVFSFLVVSAISSIISLKAQSYCTAGPSSTADSELYGVVLTGQTYSISQTATGCGTVGVQDFTSTDSADLDIGVTYALDVTSGYCGFTYYSGYVAAWIDWNADGDFDDAGEEVLSVSAPSASTYSTTITVPPTAVLGPTRMRVMQYEGGTALTTTPCASFIWGAVEDYRIRITGTPPSCLPPTGVAINSILLDSVEISYTANGIATWFEYGPPGFAQGTGTQVQVTNSPAWLTGLTSSTNYDVYVYQMCADSSVSFSYGPVSFKTLTCLPSQMCVFDIELTDSWGDGWNGAEIEILNSNGGVEYTLGSNFTSGFSHIETISLCTGGTYTIVVSDEGSYPSEIGLNVTSGGTTKATYPASTSTTLGMQLAAFSATCNALCPTPSSITFSAGKNSVSFSFNKNGGTGTYIYEWAPTGFLQATGTGFTPGLDSTTSNNFTISGLASNSCYDLIIIQNCGANGVSDTIGPVPFCTGLCDTTDLCDFTISMYDTFGDGWNGATVDLYFNGVFGQTFGSNFTSGDSLIVDFQICAGTEISIVNSSQGFFPQEVYYTLSGSNGQSASVSPGNFNAGPVDTLTANCVTPSCATPSNLGVANMGSTFADISWTGGNGTFIYHYTASGSTNTTMGTSTSAMASMTGLAPVTTYFFDVAEVCAPGDTSLKMHYSFTTDSCSAINVGNPNYSIDSIGTSFADITFTWGGASGYTSYFINFGDGFNATGTGSTHSHSYTANGQYTAVLKLYGDCDTTSQQIFVNIQGIGLEEKAAQSILMYPNPTSGLIHISGTAEQGEEVQMRVMNYVGQEMFNTTITTTNGTFEKDFDLSGFSSGTYLIEIRTINGMIQRPFVVRH